MLNFVYIILFSALLGAGGIIFHSNYLVGAAVTVLILFAVEVLLFVLFCKKSHLRLSVNKPVVKKGEAFEAEIFLKNPTPMIIGECSVRVSVKNFYCREKQQIINFSAVPFLGGKARLAADCMYNGNVSVCISEAKITDFFGVITKKINCGDVCTVMVVPPIKSTQLSNIFSYAESDGLNTEEVRADSGDPDGVREYVQGDRLNSIHWKLSASNAEDKMYVRNFLQNMTDKIIVLFEYYKDNADAVIDSLFSTAGTLLDGGRDFVLVWVNGGDEAVSQFSVTCKRDFTLFAEQLYASFPSQNEAAAMDCFVKLTGTRDCIYIDSTGNIVGR